MAIAIGNTGRNIIPPPAVAEAVTLCRMAQTAADRLKLARVAAGYRTALSFADRHGIPQSTYALHEAGKRSLSTKRREENETPAERYARLLGNCTPGWLLTGEGRSPMSARSNGHGSNAEDSELVDAPLDVCYIVGVVEAGAWREAIELPREEWERVYFEDRPEFRGAQRFGLRVRGPSMNRFYPPGTILDCVRFIGISRRPREGDHVVVYRRGPGDLMEATVKELIRSGERWELWPRSDHPAHKSPLALEGAPEDDTNEDLRIVALVIGAYTRRP